MKRKINKNGFTLVELMVVVGIVAIMLVGVSNLFFATLVGGGKAAELAELKDQGDYATLTMERLIRDGADVNITGGADCGDRSSPTASNYLEIHYLEDDTDPPIIPNPTVIQYLAAGERITINGYDVTTPDVRVVPGGGLFTCSEVNDTFVPDEVNISFDLFTSNGTISESFRSTVVLRNTNSD